MPCKPNFKNNFLLLMPKLFWDVCQNDEYPIAATIEMAIASFLDTEALGFVDCKPGRGQ
ncbi:MAG: hypothetical protein JGK03_31340 [Microcoleus sp. PH2017_25_DOB_D_A]|uniref:hypothetical protein n=1 Tax=unclassified Microcoleus TaxID=2642155 RepID=UPI001DF603B7|nr:MULTISPECIES: hypothetical protein [unclassified Microcoleus]MCC3538574.1 hypothetical protein [Microcoleus sp. PH2017_25_DOB_D_A]MCC3568921.1 hypothetical protein [Microcoleus sp. PH2017_31_RDM_U_A]